MRGEGRVKFGCEGQGIRRAYLSSEAGEGKGYGEGMY